MPSQSWQTVMSPLAFQSWQTISCLPCLPSQDGLRHVSHAIPVMADCIMPFHLWWTTSRLPSHDELCYASQELWAKVSPVFFKSLSSEQFVTVTGKERRPSLSGLTSLSMVTLLSLIPLHAEVIRTAFLLSSPTAQLVQPTFSTQL